MTLTLSNWIELLGAIGAIAASIAAWFAIRQSNKQLEIEQTPYVALDHIKRDQSRYGFSIRNIGKGSAVSVTFSTSDKISKRNSAFFSDDQPHSANLTPSEISQYWMVDGNVLDSLKVTDNFSYIYIFFESQSNRIFQTKVKIKKTIDKKGDAAYVVMENQVIEVKGKVGI